MNLARFARRRYCKSRTPLEGLPRFSRALGGPNVYIKRDDLLDLTGGGNKTRKLEFLVADALAKGADTLITCGGVQSNHCRLTLAAAVKEGLKCRLVLAESAPGSYQSEDNGNVFLYNLLGAERIIIVPWGSDLAAEMAKAAEEAASAGGRPYIIPLGGSDPIGTLGYAACAEEIMQQSFEQGMDFNRIIVAVGSAGTLSGLLIGLYGNNCDIPVTGISVLQKREAAEEAAAVLVEKTKDYMKVEFPVPRDGIVCIDEFLGPGYTVPTPEMIEAVKLLARTEGILLDPTYTGKAMAGLIGLARRGIIEPGENVLFVHTGGLPGLFARTGLFNS